ncbi:MAG: enoyl-CoA hydratase, partial [Erythrobacter sp.]|nr:enoyl-CoA hydratase [Erythrobacter sp.]
MADFTQILVDKADGIATVMLNRPEKMNAFTNVMMQEIITAMDDLD